MDVLEHPLDRHALYRRELSEYCNPLKCTVCSSSIHGSTSIYCCERCQFYLHRSCAAEIPSLIPHHPLHPDHPLNLGAGEVFFLGRIGWCSACERSAPESRFYCSSCPFVLHVRCAMVNLVPDEETGPEQAAFEHFAHECPLASLNVKHEYSIECKACDLKLSGEVYGCRRCIFFLHKTCAELPREIRRHPFHSNHPLTLAFHGVRGCSACNRWMSAVYLCQDCEFELCHDRTNAALPLGCLREETEDSRPPADHFFHQHPLAFYCTEKVMQVHCKACDQHVSGEFYGCLDCSFFVQEPCLQSLPRDIRHYLHPNPDHPLTLSLTPSGTCMCNSCIDFLPMNFLAYNCKACDFYLHVPCALQTLAYLEQGTSKRIEKLMIDTFEWTLCYAKGSSSHRCHSCDNPCQGLAYRWTHSWLHESCAEALLNLDPFHRQRRVTLIFEHDSEDCNVCGGIISSNMRYRYEESWNFKMHLSCLGKPTLKHPLHAHGLTYFQRMHKSNSRCRACGKTCAVDLYCCEVCNVHIHYDCLQLPQTIKSNHHVDELTLHESIVEDDSGEYYCDICERRRDPEL